jgi:hypothetical protein
MRLRCASAAEWASPAAADFVRSDAAGFIAGRFRGQRRSCNATVRQSISRLRDPSGPGVLSEAPSPLLMPQVKCCNQTLMRTSVWCYIVNHR